LSKQRPDISFSRLRPAILKVIGAGLLMGVFCALGLAFFNQFEWSEKLHAGLTVGTLVPAGAAFYFGLLYLFKFEELQEMWALVRRVLPGDR
ncbi:MAG: hypothetical protein NWR36_06395, partial [Opitutales bacterium]|nr:hypothetical protein [Opitutales bacterium]